MAEAVNPILSALAAEERAGIRLATFRQQAITVLFADIVGFTRLCERLTPAGHHAAARV